MLNITNYHENENENPNNTSHLLEWLVTKLSKRKKKVYFGDNIGKRESLYTVNRNVNYAVNMENAMKIPKKIKKLPYTQSLMPF